MELAKKRTLWSYVVVLSNFYRGRRRAVILLRLCCLNCDWLVLWGPLVGVWFLFGSYIFINPRIQVITFYFYFRGIFQTHVGSKSITLWSVFHIQKDINPLEEACGILFYYREKYTVPATTWILDLRLFWNYENKQTKKALKCEVILYF